MSPLDASFLLLEDEVSHFHIGSVGIFEPPAPSDEALTAHVASRLDAVPRFRQRVRFVPLDLGRPVWVDDKDFVLDYHLRHTALPAPGSTAQLQRLVGRVMSQQLDRHRPLWEMWAVDGLEGGRWALVTKVHHCMVDGVAGTDLWSRILTPEADPPPAELPAWTPAPAPGDLELLADALIDVVTNPFEQARLLRSRLDLERLRHRVADLREGLGALGRIVREPAASSLNGPIGPHRRWTWASGGLDDVRTIRRTFGGTVNDVVLAAITWGFRQLLLARDEDIAGRTVRTMVPVNVRAPDQVGNFDNRVASIFADLPVDLDDPVAVLASLRAQMDEIKGNHQITPSEWFVRLGDVTPPVLQAAGSRVVTRLLPRLQHVLNTVTTNVPGPQHPLYLAGRRLERAYPYVPLAEGLRIGVAIFSYCGRLGFGLTGDWDTAPDIGVLASGIEDGLAQLVARAAERD